MEKEARDHILAVVKAGVSAVPMVGGTLASLIGDYIPSATQNTIERSIEMLQTEMERLGDRIDTESLNKDEFSELFKSCYLTIVRTHQEEKLRGAVALITNILLKKGDAEKLIYTELDHFARCLDVLSVGAIQILGYCVGLARSGGRIRSNTSNVRMDFSDIHRRVPDMPVDLIMGLLEELNSFHLVHLTGTPSARTPNYGNYPIEVTPIGVRFSTYILKQGKADAS
ncbi:hypothetical protein KA005_39015 [bacterium]|nr:hypothetical protein [bacterium]